MKEVKELEIKVVYKVGLGEFEMPDDVYEQLSSAYLNNDEIDGLGNQKREEAVNWLIRAIKQRDAMHLVYEVEHIEDED